MVISDSPILLKFDFDSEAEELWEALVLHDKMIIWYFENIPNFEAVPGFTCQFLIKNQERKFTHNWEVLESIYQKHISYKWSYLEYPGDSTVQFLIEDKLEGCELTIRIDIYEDFPSDIPEFKVESCIAGWRYFMERLQGFLKENASERTL